jgi:hypothetical protein
LATNTCAGDEDDGLDDDEVQRENANMLIKRIPESFKKRSCLMRALPPRLRRGA